jgi:hypothetical protein
MPSGLDYDDSAPRAMLAAIMGKVPAFALAMYAAVEAAVMPEIHQQIPYDENEAAMYREAVSLGIDLTQLGPDDQEYHMEDHIFFTVDPADPLIAMCGTNNDAMHEDYPAQWHEETPKNGFSKPGANDHYITNPVGSVCPNCGRVGVNPDQGPTGAEVMVTFIATENGRLYV